MNDMVRGAILLLLILATCVWMVFLGRARIRSLLESGTAIDSTGSAVDKRDGPKLYWYQLVIAVVGTGVAVLVIIAVIAGLLTANR